MSRKARETANVIGDQVAIDDLGELSFQAAQRLARGLVLGQLAAVVIASRSRVHDAGMELTVKMSPGNRGGIVESIRALRAVRSGAVKDRGAALNSLKAMIITAPAELRSALDHRHTMPLVRTCAALRPDRERLSDPLQGTKAALRSLARRIVALEGEIGELDAALAELVRRAAPRTVSLLAIGVDHAGQLLVTAGERPERLRSEAAFAHLCVVAPIPASSGQTQRHRLHRGGDRAANRALHLAVVVRLRCCPRTRAYVERRTRERDAPISGTSRRVSVSA